MFLVAKPPSNQQLPQQEGLGDSRLHGKCVHLEYHKVNELNLHPLGEMVNGSVVTSPLVRSLRVRIVRSALLTCSFAAVVLHSTLGISGFNFSISPSIKNFLL